MRGRILAMGVAAAVGAALGTALLAGAGDRGAEPEAGSEPRAAADVAAVRSSPGKAIAGAHPQAIPPKKGRVPAGVLVRAASRRAQEREAANPPAPPDRRRGREEGEVLSVDIDWHAGANGER